MQADPTPSLALRLLQTKRSIFPPPLSIREAEPEFVHQVSRNSRSGRRERVAQGNRAPVHVNLIYIQSQVLDARQRLCAERLVDLQRYKKLVGANRPSSERSCLDEIQVLDPLSGGLQNVSDGRGGADAHDRRLDADRRETDDAGERR